MSTYPTSPRSAFLEWCQTHVATFLTSPAAIGLTPAQASAFNAATDAAAAASMDQGIAREASKTATLTAEVAFDALRASASEVVRTIRTFAENSADPNAVYIEAQIPPPSPPTPAPPPAQPTDFTVTLDSNDGSMVLRWKAANPVGTTGTAYVVRRKLPGESEFAFLGISGKKEFIDDTLVAGPDSVQYTVQGQRGNLAGPVSPTFIVSFGRAPDGGFTTAFVREGMPATGGTYAADKALVDAIVSSRPGAASNGRTAKASNGRMAKTRR